MTQDTTKLNVEVSDNGTAADVLNRVKELNSVVNKSGAEARAARKELKTLLNEPGMPGGTSGSRKFSRANNAIDNYTKQRGVGGLTGASGRDFAAQAQGLDGIVRLYATYAANVFALGAAFRGLGTAMDTQNMVKGLDQLGASVGRNLGGLSQRVTELTGGAISMREAMQAVALTSSGGMSAKNIERLAGVARSASLALGVAMPDAISRLSRGITKLEPELLDELGIMTRLEPATQAYARQLGKTVTQLTDFERRQAFANAVLAEGEAKFGAITNLQTNPYDKLVSSLKNLAQSGAEVVNKVLAPVANFLSESPALLGGGVLALLSSIIKKAIPEIGEFKEQLSDAVNKSAELAKLRAKEANEAELRLTTAARKQAEERAEIQIAAVQRAEDRIKSIRDKSVKDFKVASSVLNKLTATGSVDDTDLRALEATAKRRDHSGKKEEAKAYRDTAAAIREYIAAQAASIAQIEKEQGAIAKQSLKEFSIAGITRALAAKAEEEAIKKSIISNAAYNASLIGITHASAIMKEEIKASTLSLTLWGRSVLLAQGYAAMFAGVLSTIGNAFIKLTNAVAWIGTIIAIFSTIDSVLGGARKELDNFNKVADNTKASIENINRTVMQLDRTMSSGTINGISSMANALDDLNNNFIELISSIRATKKELSSSLWDTLKDTVASVFGGGVDNKFSENLVGSIKGALDILARSNLKEEANTTFKSILNVTSLDIDTIRVAVGKLKAEGIDKLQEAMSNLSREQSNSSSRVQNFKQSIEAATRAYQQFIQSTANTTPLFRVGAALQNLGTSMFHSVDNIKLGIGEINAAINHISEVPDAGVIFGSGFIDELVQVREEFMSQNKAISAYKKALIDLDKQITNSDFARLKDLSPEVLSDKALEGLNKLKELAKTKEEIEKNVTLLSEQQSEKARSLFNKGLDTAFAKGAELIRVSLGQAMEKGTIAIGKAALAGLTGADRARAENALNKQELDIQLRAIETNVDLILSQALLRASLDKMTASNNLSTARAAGKSEQEIKALEAVEQASDIFYKIIKEGQTPNFANISRFTNNPDVITRVQVNSVADNQRLAEQTEARKLLEAQRTALGVSGAINVRMGNLEDLQKEINFQQQIIQNDSQRVNLVNNLLGLTSEVTAKIQAEADRKALLLKQSSELLAIDTAIANAGGNDGERRKQEDFRLLVLSRHERELELQNLTSSQKIIQASLELLFKQLDLTKAINDSNYRAGIAQVDVLTAQNNAYNTLYGASAGFAAIQNEIVGKQRAQLDFVNLIGNAQIDFLKQEEKAKRDLATLDPEKDSSAIKRINQELEIQANLTKTNIKNAKTQLTTQEKILEINKKAALQQDRYNRILNNSTKAANSMAKAFGNFGTALGTIAEAFANMVVNSDKNFNELANIRKQQEGLKKDSKEFVELEAQYNMQRTQYSLDQIANYGAMAGAAKNMFDEQSAGYKALAIVEKALFVMHIALSLKQMAADAAATATSLANTETRIAAHVAEAEVAGIKAILVAISSLPFPADIVAGVVIAGIVAGLLSTIGGKSKAPSISGGFSADDMQSTQGTGRKFVNGKLTDTNFGALGAPTEKVADVANAIEIIKNSTALTATYSQKTLNSLEAIEENTRQVAASAFKGTSIGKLTSGFGTVEGSSKTKGFTIMSPTTKRTIEIIDKGIQVLGTFNDIIEGTAKFLEYETIQTTKKKSAAMGLIKKTKISISTNSKDLPQDSQDLIINLFANLASAAVSASKQILGEANNKIQDVLDNFVVSFKTSGMGLTGEQFAEALLAETSVIMNQVAEQALPQFEEFRKLGEGFIGTILRMSSTIDIVSEKIGLLYDVDVQQIVKERFKLSDSVLSSIQDAANKYTDVLNNTIQDGLKNGIVTVTKSVLNTWGTGFIKETTILKNKPNEEQIAILIDAEQNLADSRNQIAKDLGLSNSRMVEDLNTLQSAFTQAQLSILDNINAQKDFETVNKLISGELIISGNQRMDAQKGINDEVKNLYHISLDLAKASKIVTDAFSDQNFVSLMLYNSLVETMGGLEEFTKKTDFFFENFFSDSEQLVAKTKQVNQALVDFANEGLITSDQLAMLTDGVGNLRLEFRSVAEAQNLFTESGRKAYNTLLSFAPAIADITDTIPDALTGVKKSIEDLLDEFGLSVDDFSDIFSRAVLSDDKIEDLGAEIANTIRQGYLKAISSSFMDNISNAFVNNIISPILSSVMGINDKGYATATGNFTSFIGNLTQNAINLSNMLSNPVFNEAINSATTVATTAITKLTTTLRNADNIFSNSKLLDYTNELADLQKEFDTTTLQNAVDAEQTRLDLLQEQADVLKSTVEDLKDFNNRMTDFKNSLLIGPQSPLTPLDQYATVKTQLEQAFQTSTMGVTEEDRKAARDKIEELSNSFLEVSRSVYSSGAQYTNDFNFVQSILDSLITDSGVQLSMAEQQLAALNVQIDASNTIIKNLQAQLKAIDEANNSLQDISGRITELTDLIAKEYGKGKDAIVNSFSILDSNVNGLLTLDELKASGIASDKTIEQYLTAVDANGDGQISRLEAITAASNNTYYTLQSLVPIFEAVKSGIISMDSAVSLIAEANRSNTGKGGSSITGTYTGADGNSVSIDNTGVPKFTSTLGGYIQGNTVYGVNGASISLSSAKNELAKMVEDTASGRTTAKDVYNTLISWGVNSALVATMLGTSQKDVLDWFKFYDSSIPAFAKGIDIVPEDMLAQIHKDERIMPAADNRLLMQSLSSRNDTNLELINELKTLNQKIDRLEKVIELGSVINAEATNKNTEELAKVITDTSSVSNHNNTIKEKVTLR